jgi:protein-S-isoprenylcysteine O-methyltransferase Ste14
MAVVVVVVVAVVRAPAEERIVAAKVIDEAYADSVQTESAFAWPSLVIAFDIASR